MLAVDPARPRQMQVGQMLTMMGIDALNSRLGPVHSFARASVLAQV